MASFRQSLQNESVWWAITNEVPSSCPNCQSHIHFIGYAPEYNDSYAAHMYCCHNCGAWIDCLEPCPQSDSQSDDKTADVS